jgi:hypothetical protein
VDQARGCQARGCDAIIASQPAPLSSAAVYAARAFRRTECRRARNPSRSRNFRPTPSPSCR